MNSPFGYQPSREEKEIKVLKERVAELESKLEKLIKILYNNEFSHYKDGTLIPSRTYTDGFEPLDKKLTDLL